MIDQGHIIFSYSFDDKGKTSKLDNQKVAKEVENEGLTWVHLDANNQSTKNWLNQEVYYLDHLVIDALIAEETRPRIIEFASGILVILRGIGRDEKSQEMVSIRMWIDDQRIITIQRKEMKAVWDVCQNIDSKKTIKNSGEFLYNLIYQILIDTSEKVNLFNEKIDNLEDKIITTHNIKFRKKILQIRSQSATFKRYLLPQKEVISKLRSSNQVWIDDWSKRHFQENFDQISHVIERVDEVINRSQILHEELANALSEKLNKSMYKLSLITAVFMPLTFVTGLLGMNVGGIPGSQNSFAFYIWSGLMIVVTLFHVLSFKKKDWF
jgi:zinc transporter